ncbi:transglutaminase-like domain-containing protein [Danxiaibacter flavus]|uniref:Transglutaminase-like domain-containing protein n=1 Tax=Danxiaibacter flavus TaxID=3049108 RepID=A0ABV3ZFH4_9BACT|nr:transglutaminase-like domain-containing protein [Chitinophagaceae bacterium DXS]
MLKPLSGLVVCLIFSTIAYSQFQTADAEGALQASNLKKIDKKAKYGAYLINKEFQFNTAKGINNQSIVTSQENSVIEMASIAEKTPVGYLVPFNSFVKLKDYDFQIYYKNGFKTVKYPPERISLTDDNIFLDDAYGELYGYRAEEVGQRYRFKYEAQYTDAKYLTRVFFHESFPVKQAVISFKVPSWLELEVLEKNFEGYKIRKETQKGKDFTVYKYTATDMSGIKHEAMSLARPFYLPHLIITVKSFTLNNQKINGFKSVDDIYAWYNFLYRKAQNNIDAIKAQVATLTQGKPTDEEKIKSIYYWVQDNIRYIAFEEGYSGFVPQTVQDVYKNKYGDCKGMANLLTEMLKIAGYDAHFAWIGTREIPYDITEVQSMCVDNHAISVLYLKGKTYFIDGTEKYAAFGKDAARIQGKKVLVEHGDSYKIETVPVPPIDNNQISTISKLKIDGEKMTGHMSVTFDGESRHFFHYIYNNVPADKRKNFVSGLLEGNSENTEVSNIKTSDFTNREIPITIEGDIEVNNQVTQIDKTLYTTIDFFPRSIMGFNPEENRQSPIDLGNLFVATDKIMLELDGNTKPASLPKKFTAAFNKNQVDAEYNYSNNTISLQKKTTIASPVILPADFEAWKKFVASVKEFNRSSISIQQ